MLKIILLVLLCCLLDIPLCYATPTTEASSALAELVYSEVSPPRAKAKVKKRQKSRQKPPFTSHHELSFLHIALYLSLAAALILLIGFNIELILFSLLFSAIFCWFISGLFAIMATIILLANTTENHKEQNEEAAWLLILFILTRIGLLIFLSTLIGPVLTIVLSITFVPGFIVYLTAIISAFNNYKTKIDIGKMFRKPSKN